MSDALALVQVMGVQRPQPLGGGIKGRVKGTMWNERACRAWLMATQTGLQKKSLQDGGGSVLLGPDGCCRWKRHSSQGVVSQGLDAVIWEGCLWTMGIFRHSLSFVYPVSISAHVENKILCPNFKIYAEGCINWGATSGPPHLLLALPHEGLTI